MSKVLIAPSTDPSPLSELTEYVKELERDKADWLHCDVMDGVFVERKTIDEVVVSLLSTKTQLPLDVHLMVANPQDKVASYAKAGAHSITVHYEAFGGKMQLLNTLHKMRTLGVKVGLSIKPGTDIECILRYLPLVDIFLVMSVEPGKSGQSFIKDSLTKIAFLQKYREENKLNFLIEVDGGINEKNVNMVVGIGADIIVAGSAIYNSDNRAQTISKLRCE